jgi:iron complex outermembrane receptor protein
MGSTLLASMGIADQALAQAAPAPADVTEVVVTGSRVKKDAFNAPEPILVITSESAKLAGYADTASMLQQSSIAAGSFQTNGQLTGYVVTGGPGAQTLNLRRLGAQRTIILMDGKRLGPAGVGGTVGPVDLNVVPQSIIDKVEVLKDGASSIYGSDAVAGVVNIITKKKHDGATFDIYANGSQGAGGNTYLMSGDWGKTFDKGFIEVAAEYYAQESLTRGQRDYTSCNEDYLFNPKTGARVDFAADPITYNYGHQYKCYNLTSNDIATTANGTLQYLRQGVAYPTAAQGNNVPTAVSASLGGQLNTFFARQARAGYPATYPYANYSTPFTNRATVISPDRHYNLSANVGYDLDASAHLYGQFQFSERLSFQTGARQLFPTLGATWKSGNPNNIFAGTGVSAVYPIIALPSDYRQDVKYMRGVAGIKGDVRNLGWFNRFSYDAYVVYSRSDADYQNDSIYNDRVVASTTGASACNPLTPNLSNFNCGGLGATGIPWLSQRVVSGQFTQAERDFLFFKAHGSTQYDQIILESDFTGDLMNLPAGPLGSAFGVSYRHDRISDTPDVQAQNGNLWGQTASGHTAGTDGVGEAYLELNVPVLKNLPFIQNLTADLSGRYSDYNSYGSTTTYKVATNWTVSPELKFRGSVGSSFRAPALYELYLAHQTGFLGQTSVDPCVNYGSSSVSATVQAKCASLGISPTYTGVSPNGGGGSATISTGGGIGNLQAETSLAKSVGVVVTPKHFGIDTWTHLSVAVDYFQFKVSNEVDRFGSLGIITQCYQGNTAFCGLFQRDLNPTSASYLNILTVNNNYVNVASQYVNGLDVTIRADHEFGDKGKLAFEANMTWTMTDKKLLLGGSSVQDYNGATYNYDGPDFAGNASLRWDRGNYTVFWNTQFIGKGSDTQLFGGDVFSNSRYANVPAGITSAQTYYKQYVGTKIYHDVSVRRRLPALNLEVTLGMRNVFDEAPPSQSAGQFRDGTAALNAYDMIGRQFFGRLSKKW